MPENNHPEDDAQSPPKKAIIPAGNTGEPPPDKRSPEDWVSGIGSGIKGVSRKLLDQVPPEFREKIIEQARTHGPGAAAVAVNAAALKTRNFKTKIALKALAKLLNVLESKVPKKQDDQENKKEP